MVKFAVHNTEMQNMKIKNKYLACMYYFSAMNLKTHYNDICC